MVGCADSIDYDARVTSFSTTPSCHRVHACTHTRAHTSHTNTFTKTRTLTPKYTHSLEVAWEEAIFDFEFPENSAENTLCVLIFTNDGIGVCVCVCMCVCVCVCVI